MAGIFRSIAGMGESVGATRIAQGARWASENPEAVRAGVNAGQSILQRVPGLIDRGKRAWRATTTQLEEDEQKYGKFGSALMNMFFLGHHNPLQNFLMSYIDEDIGRPDLTKGGVARVGRLPNSALNWRKASHNFDIHASYGQNINIAGMPPEFHPINKVDAIHHMKISKVNSQIALPQGTNELSVWQRFKNGAKAIGNKIAAIASRGKDFLKGVGNALSDLKPLIDVIPDQEVKDTLSQITEITSITEGILDEVTTTNEFFQNMDKDLLRRALSDSLKIFQQETGRNIPHLREDANHILQIMRRVIKNNVPPSEQGAYIDDEGHNLLDETQRQLEEERDFEEHFNTAHQHEDRGGIVEEEQYQRIAPPDPNSIPIPPPLPGTQEAIAMQNAENLNDQATIAVQGNADNVVTRNDRLEARVEGMARRGITEQMLQDRIRNLNNVKTRVGKKRGVEERLEWNTALLDAAAQKAEERRKRQKPESDDDWSDQESGSGQVGQVM